MTRVLFLIYKAIVEMPVDLNTLLKVTVHHCVDAES